MRNLFFILSILFSSGLYAQNQSRTINEILENREQQTGIYRITGTHLMTSVVNMNYGKSNTLSVMNKKALQSANIIQIDLVYTNYPKGQDISELNKQRILNMLSIRSDLVKNKDISWSIVRQMYCNSEAQAKMMFHGAVIYYQPEQSQSLSLSERKNYGSLPKDDTQEFTEKDIKKKFRDNPVVLNSFDRNQWKNPVVVADVTCSMYPYMKQVAFWFLLKMNKKEEAYIALFNDGNGIANDKKIIGQTGGVHSVKTIEYARFRETLLKSVSYGCSGDAEENDVEALYKAQRDNPNAKELILIADNLSDMRDHKLISKIKKPVRIILCGTKYRLNLQYLNLAFATGGSIHTIKEDLNDLIKKSEGDSFEFEGRTYNIENGKVVESNSEKIQM